jgi:hypothetical protein
MSAGGTNGGKAGDVQTGQEILFDVADSVFDAPLGLGHQLQPFGM